MNKNKELLFSVTKKDFEVTYYSGTGNGGQNRNKHQNCVRIKHIETGIITTGQEERDRLQNQKNAFKRMCEHPQFKIWLNNKISASIKKEQDINKIVDDMMKEDNLKIEYFDIEV